MFEYTIEDYPWRHQIIHKFFSDTEFQEVVQASKKLLEKYKGQPITGHDCLTIGQVYDTIGHDAYKILMDYNNKLLDSFDSIVANFPNHRTFNKYFCVPTFHILPENTGPQKIHDEAYDKTLSLVVYLYPESNIGTAIFKDSTQESFVKEIEWEQNKAMLFCGEKNVTWHDFYSNDNPRVTLNFFIRELVSTELVETDDYYYFKGVDGPKTVLPKTLPEHIMTELTSGALFK